MSEPEKVKLTTAGDTLTLQVMKCAPAAVGNFPGIEFTGITTDKRLVVLEVPKASTDRQLARLEVSYQECVGRTLIFTRDPNPGQPSKAYWGINFGEGQSAPAVAAPPAARSNVKQGIDIGGPIPGLDDVAPLTDRDAPPDVRHPQEFDAPNAGPAADKLTAMFKLYDICFTHATATASKATNMNPDVAAMAATLFIQANMKGLAA